MVTLLEYLMVGLLVSIGWHIGKVIGLAIEEIADVRLHRAKWYMNIIRPKQQNMKNKPESRPYGGTTIGFVAKDRELR